MVSAYSIQHAFSAIWRSVSGHLKYFKIRTFSIIFAKRGLMADNLLILASPSLRCLWLFPISMLSFSPNCWSRSGASQDLVRPFPPRLLMNAPNVSCMTCAMPGMWFFNAGHSVPESSSVDCILRVIEWFDEALSLVIPSKRPSVSSKPSSTSFKYTASLALVCWSLNYHSWLAFETGNEQEINFIESELYFTQCPILIRIVCNDWPYAEFAGWCPSIQSWTNFISWWQLLLNCIHGQCLFPPANVGKGYGGWQHQVTMSCCIWLS